MASQRRPQLGWFPADRRRSIGAGAEGVPPPSLGRHTLAGTMSTRWASPTAATGARGRRGPQLLVLLSLLLTLSSCGRAAPGGAGARSPGPAPVRLPGPCASLSLPQAALVVREPTPDARATGFPVINSSFYRRRLDAPTLARELLAAACATPEGSCSTVTVLPATLLNGYLVTFLRGRRRLATVVGTPSIPCGTLFLVAGSSGPPAQESTAPFLAIHPGWIDLSGNAKAFFALLASALRVPVARLTS